MKITEVRIHHLNTDKGLKAFVTVTFDNALVVRGLKIVGGPKGLMLCMPAKEQDDGTFKDMAHPINANFRKYLEEEVLKEFMRALSEDSERMPDREA